MKLERVLIKASNEDKNKWFCVYAILFLSSVISAGLPFGPANSYTWGISNDQLDIPVGSIITAADLTIHNPVFTRDLAEGVVYIQLLDNPDADITEYTDSQPGNFFSGYGVYLTSISPFSLSTTVSDITIELDKLGLVSSVVSPLSFEADSSELAGPLPSAYRSAMPGLLDYAGTGRSFGFGLDCDGFTFDALTLELTIGSMTSLNAENRLVFTIQNPNYPPMAMRDLYIFKQNDPAQTLFVLSNDSDPDGDSLSILAVGTPFHGQVEIIEDSTAIRYTPAVGYIGFDRFAYTISDGYGETAISLVTIYIQAPPIPSDTIFESDAELTFDGVDSYQSVSTDGWNLSGTTISFWCKADTLGSSQYLLGHTVGSWSNRVQLYIRNGQLGLGLGNAHSLAPTICPIQAQQWYFVCLSWDGTSYYVSVNDQVVASGIHAGLTAFNSFADFGNTGNPNWRTDEAFFGTIDDIRIYARPLSQTEIAQLYTYGRNASY